jgi:hypothetical protein
MTKKPKKRRGPPSLIRELSTSPRAVLARAKTKELAGVKLSYTERQRLGAAYLAARRKRDKAAELEGANHHG